MPREVVVEDRKRPDQLDLLAYRDGEAVGAASTAKFGGAPEGEFAYLTLRVVAEHRRHGVGTALHSVQRSMRGGSPRRGFYAVVRDDDRGSLGYYDACGFVEIGRMQDVVLDSPRRRSRQRRQTGSRSSSRHRTSSEARMRSRSRRTRTSRRGRRSSTGDFETWQARHFGPLDVA